MAVKKKCLIMYVDEDYRWTVEDEVQEGHQRQPHHEHGKQCAMLAERLRDHGFDVQVENSFEPLDDAPLLAKVDLIVPNQTGGKIPIDQLRNFSAAVQGGVGLAGFHAGMGDWERNKEPGKPGFQHMTGGQYVMHYGGDDLKFEVNIVDREHYITRGLNDFTIQSEQWWMLVDPANHVLATTPFPVAGKDGPHVPNGHVDMPVAWTRYFGQGRVFFTSLGHHVRDLERDDVGGLVLRGFMWAANAEGAQR